MRNRAIVALVGVLVTALLLAWVLKDVSLREVWIRATAAHLGTLLATVAVATSTFVLWDPLESTCRHASLSIL